MRDRGDITSNLLATLTRIMPIDVVSENVITCGG